MGLVCPVVRRWLHLFFAREFRHFSLSLPWDGWLGHSVDTSSEFVSFCGCFVDCCPRRCGYEGA